MFEVPNPTPVEHPGEKSDHVSNYVDLNLGPRLLQNKKDSESK